MECCLSDQQYDPYQIEEKNNENDELYLFCEIRNCIKENKNGRPTFCQRNAFDAYRSLNLKSNYYIVNMTSKERSAIKEK